VFEVDHKSLDVRKRGFGTIEMESQNSTLDQSCRMYRIMWQNARFCSLAFVCIRFRGVTLRAPFAEAGHLVN
jgi:hypothetical protein